MQGAATTIWCATSPVIVGMGGVYSEDCDIAVAVPPDHPEPRGVHPRYQGGVAPNRATRKSMTVRTRNDSVRLGA